MTEVIILRPKENMQTIIITMIPTTNVQECFVKFFLVKVHFFEQIWIKSQIAFAL